MGVIGIDPRIHSRRDRASSRSTKLRIGYFVGLIAALAAIALPASAIAAPSPTKAQYVSQVNQTFGTGGGGNFSPPGGSVSPPSTSGKVGSLPFTGLDVAVLALIGSGLLATGAVLRRRQRATGEQA
jgi:hypothetical protein